MATFTCTACALTFTDVEGHKAHYKLDWHRYNLRRKVSGLGPVNQGDFDRRLAASLGTSLPKADFHEQCKPCRKSFRSEGLFKQHMDSKKHKETLRKLEKGGNTGRQHSIHFPVPMVSVEAGGTVAPPAPVTETHQEGPLVVTDGVRASAMEISITVGDTLHKEKKENDNTKESGESQSHDGSSDERENGDQLPTMGENICIFCNLQCEDFDGNCRHMLHAHGFFIPDVEYLVDAKGLIKYLEEKVKIGNICLYCNGKGKGFHGYRAVQQHMMDRSHCKILYEEGEDLHEYENFYDFSPSYTDAEKEGLVRRAARPEQSASDGESATDSEGEEYFEVAKTMGVTSIGELVLLDGRTVGNRSLRRYYKQRLRYLDEREPVQAQRKEQQRRLLAIYNEAGEAVAVSHHSRSREVAFGGLMGVKHKRDVKMLQAYQRQQSRQHLKTGLRQNKLNRTFNRVAEL